MARVRDLNGPLPFYNTSLKTVKILDGGAGKIGLGFSSGVPNTFDFTFRKSLRISPVGRGRVPSAQVHFNIRSNSDERRFFVASFANFMY